MSDTAKPSLHDNDALLTYRVGPVLCCGPTLPVVTIIPPPELTQLPGTNIAEPGIFKHGTNVVSASDLRHRFGVKQENWNQPAKVIIAQHENLTRGYFVDEIKDVISFPEKGWGQLPTHLPRGVFSRTLLLNDHIYLYAEFEKLSELQGTGYLADYIVHLEKLEEEKKQEVTKSAAKSSISKQTTSTLKTSEKQIDSNDDKTNTPEIKLPGIKLPDINLPEIKSSSTPSLSKDKTELPKTKEVKSKIDASVVLDKTNNKTSSPLANKKIIKSNDFDSKTTEKISGNIKKEQVATYPANNPTVANKTMSSTMKGNVTTNHIDVKTHSTEDSLLKNTSDSLPSQITKKSNIKAVKENSSENHNNDKAIANNKRISSDTSNDESSIFPVFIIIIVLLLISTAIYFALNYSSEYTLGKSSDYSAINTTDKDEKSLEQTYKDRTIDNEADSLPTPITKRDNQASEETITNQSIAVIESNDAIINTAPADSINEKSTLLTTKNTENEYHANIQHDNDTITIKLDGPLPPKINNIDKISIEDSNAYDSSNSSELENKNKQTKDEASIVAETDEHKIINQTSNTNKNIQKDTSSFEIVHIIVKGDTLWAIAKHYLLNPYRYPELAKLSKIRNPDLIYPGNRVRIIYKKSSNK